MVGYIWIVLEYRQSADYVDLLNWVNKQWHVLLLKFYQWTVMMETCHCS